MTIALFCILLATLMPIVCAGLAKGKSMTVSHKDGGYDNRSPRDWLAKQEGFKKWAQAAQENSWESHAGRDRLVAECARCDVHRASGDLRLALCDGETKCAFARVDCCVFCQYCDFLVAGF